jgi:hypothetical protein
MFSVPCSASTKSSPSYTYVQYIDKTKRKNKQKMGKERLQFHNEITAEFVHYIFSNIHSSIRCRRIEYWPCSASYPAYLDEKGRGAEEA